MNKLLTLTAMLTLALVLAAPAIAQEGVPKNCPDFINQQEAQAFFDTYPGDPEGLDADGNGIACEDLPGTSNPNPIASQENSPGTSSAGSAAGPSQYHYSEPSSATPLPATGGPPLLLGLATGAFLIFLGLAARRIIR